jgi:hypothetical protein
MPGGPVDQATIAFRRLLADAGGGEQTRVDALVVLAQRTVFAATWPGQNQAVRTLTNSGGETAMPLFTGRDVLDETAARFGWLNPDGSLSFREMDARDALRHALGRGVHFVVIDIGSEHAVEFARDEIEPLLQLQNQQRGTGPFASAGEPQAAILDAVRRSTRPPPMAAPRQPPPHGASVEIDLPFAGVKQSKVPPMRGVSQPIAPAAPTAAGLPHTRPMAQPSAARPRAMSQPTMREGRAPSVRPPPAGFPGTAMRMPSNAPPAAMSGAAQKTTALDVAAALTSAARAGEPEAQKPAPEEAAEDRQSGEQERQPGVPPTLPDALLHAVSQALRSFPEVEWACVLPDDESELPVMGVRVDPSFLSRVAEITDAILGSAEKHGQPVQVLLLNNPDLVKSARKQGKAFFPWKR